MSDSLHLFKTKRFLPLFITQFFGAFNDNAFKNALLIWFTYDVAVKTGMNAQIIVSIAAGLFILPFFLFSATAGQLVDKYEKATLTTKIKLLEVVLMFAAALCFYLQTIHGLLAVLFLLGLQSTFFGPIKYSLLPEQLRQDELIGGNGLIEGGTFLAILLGTIFGGLVIRMDHGMIIVSVSLIVFSLIGWIASYRIPKTRVGDKGLTIGWNIIAETWKIIGYARQEWTVWLSIIGISWFWLIGATFLTQLPIYTKMIINGSEHIVTLFLTIFSIGVAMGSLLCNKLLKGQINGRLVPYGSLGISLSILLFISISKHYESAPTMIGIAAFLHSGVTAWLLLGCLLILSVFSGLYVVPLYAIMQHRSKERYLARIIAVNNIFNALFMVLGSVFAVGIFSLGLTVLEVLLTVGILNVPVYFVIRRIVHQRLKHA